MSAARDLQRATGQVGYCRRHYGRDDPRTLEAETEVTALRVVLALEDLIESAPAPTPEQIDRIRRLLPPVPPS